ncbi:RNA recognition motif domain-containing protein [Ditylenchus destructor]|nr:RNA recognition motif domain-containing protein [Ditylenchus destructor]
MDPRRSLPMLSFYRQSRIYFHQITNARRQLCAFTLTTPVQRNVNHEETRRLSLCIPLSGAFYSAHSKEKLLTNHRYSAQISRQNFFCSRRGWFDDTRTLMVAGLSKETTVAALRECFSKKWDVTKCLIVRNKQTGASLKYGFVEFGTVEQAKHALEFDHFINGKQVNAKMNDNKELTVKYRIHVGGLLKKTSGGLHETSQETLHCYFSKFGDIFECGIVRSEENLSKGFGYVTYKSQDSVDRALNSRPHSIDGKEVFVEHATPRRNELTLFLGNLSPKTTDESLRDHFSKYGHLTQCNVKIDHKTGHSRGFGYVAFALKEEFERARAAYPHIIDGVEVVFKSLGQELVVDSLGPNITEDLLQKFFSQYGQVQDCRIATNSIGTTTAFVIMSNEEEISRALTERPHWIDGKLVFTHQKGEQFNLFVGGLSKNTTDEDLYETFSTVGKLVHWQVMRDWKNKLGHAFISFSSGEDLDRVMEHKPYFINGRPVNVQREGRKKQ